MFGPSIASMYTFLGHPTNHSNRGFHMIEETVVTEAPATQQDLPAIISELRSIELRRAELEQAAATAKKEALSGIVEIIRKYISDNGYTLDEIVGLLTTKKKRTRAKPVTAGARIVYTSKLDPTKTYHRGPLPGWLKEEMTLASLDPDSKEHRETYKTKHMVCSVDPAAEPTTTPAE